MLRVESPTFAPALHSTAFKASLQAIYIDEAHLLRESYHWRPAYGRLSQLRGVVGLGVPLAAISATLPAPYRASLREYAGLKPDYTLINMGNFRPELSLVVHPLRYESSRFQDLAFVLPLGCRQDSIGKTIIYCDDIEMLTRMFWWFHSRLASMQLPVSLLSILHAGLSERHDELTIDKFRSGSVRILLGTEKIGAGLNLPGVANVVQYLAKNDLTMAKFEQRRGRGGRTEGTTAVGYLLFEPELLTADPKENKGTVDPDILALVQADGCYQAVMEKWLENPPRSPSTHSLHRLCCSHCHPQLIPAQEYR